MDNKQSIIEPKKIEATQGFKKLLKIGVYKELHNRGLLTRSQLNALVGIQDNICASGG